MSSTLPSVAELRRVAAATWPERKLRHFRVVEGGWANLVLEADDELIFRFPRRIEVARALGFEVRILDYLSRRISTPVPVPLRIGTLERPEGWPYLVYRKICGLPLNEYRALDRTERARLRKFLTRLLEELAELPPTPLRRLGCQPGDPKAWRELYVRLLHRYERVGASKVSPEMDRNIRARFDAFLSSLARSHYHPVLSHRDLGSYNILWDPEKGQPSGILDWEDTRLGDPAFDLVGLLPFDASFGRPLRRMRKSSTDLEFDQRLGFYRAIRFLPELLHGIQTHRPKLVRQMLRELQGDLERRS
ncbi:MAG: aminoglycoside phosphotransferase family protein [Thermoplasmata archaeon]